MGYFITVLTVRKPAGAKAGASVFILLVNGGRTSSRQQQVALRIEEGLLSWPRKPEVVAIGEWSRL